jgi:hypothetical protein
MPQWKKYLSANRAETKMDAIQEKKDVNLRENMVEIKDTKRDDSLPRCNGGQSSENGGCSGVAGHS